VTVVHGMKARPRDAEFAWIREHAHEYPGEWVVLDGGTLVAHGFRLRDVRAALSAEVMARALFHRVDLD
jgi:hypothetical protein